MRLSSVVLPAPRYPVRTVTGIFSGSRLSVTGLRSIEFQGVAAGYRAARPRLVGPYQRRQPYPQPKPTYGPPHPQAGATTEGATTTGGPAATGGASPATASEGI